MVRPRGTWGSHLWAFMHTMTAISFENNAPYYTHYAEVLRNLHHVIPCKHCQEEYAKWALELDSIDLSESMSLFKWTVDIHNRVNQKLQKETWTYERALQEWSRPL
jgi:hypothetical protein